MVKIIWDDVHSQFLAKKLIFMIISIVHEYSIIILYSWLETGIQISLHLVSNTQLSMTQSIPEGQDQVLHENFILIPEAV